MRPWTVAVATLVVLSGLTSCSAPNAGPAAGQVARTDASSTPAATAATALPSPTPPTSAASASPSAPKDVRGTDLDQPYVVQGIVVVNRRHRVGAGYVPAWSKQPLGLRPDVKKAADRLIAASRAAGLPLSIRSGYRSYGAQATSFERALRTYPEATARAYYAEPGSSEHQTGLAIDLWDGRNRGNAFKRTPQAAWIARHAHEYGFIVRYPQGRTDVTGYQWEPWHLRYVGTAVASRFGPNSTLTLEEYLGVS